MPTTHIAYTHFAYTQFAYTQFAYSMKKLHTKLIVEHSMYDPDV